MNYSHHSPHISSAKLKKQTLNIKRVYIWDKKIANRFLLNEAEFSEDEDEEEEEEAETVERDLTWIWFGESVPVEQISVKGKKGKHYKLHKN